MCVIATATSPLLLRHHTGQTGAALSPAVAPLGTPETNMRTHFLRKHARGRGPLPCAPSRGVTRTESVTAGREDRAERRENEGPKPAFPPTASEAGSLPQVLS